VVLQVKNRNSRSREAVFRLFTHFIVLTSLVAFLPARDVGGEGEIRTPSKLDQVLQAHMVNGDLKPLFSASKLASLNRSFQSNNGTFCVSGMAEI
jgi:hypothetical protein